MQPKKCTDWFKVYEFKDIADPTDQIHRKEMVVSLDQLPSDFGLGPNPREPDLKSNVSKDIGRTLEKVQDEFHLLNRGITIVAKGLEYDNKSKRVRLTLDEDEDEKRLYGVLDGGNTYARLNLWRKNLSDEEAIDLLEKTSVNVQILLPNKNESGEMSSEMIELLNRIKEARNTSVQVKEKSLADCRNQFEPLKEALKQQPYFEDIL